MRDKQGFPRYVKYLGDPCTYLCVFHYYAFVAGGIKQLLAFIDKCLL